MLKKSFIILGIVTLLISFSSIVFANNMLEDATEGVRNVVGGAENALEDAGRSVGNAVSDGSHAITESGDKVKNEIHNTNTKVNNDTDGVATTRTGNYVASRTATTSTLAMSTNLWTWFVLAILGVVIISLIYYYANQNTEVTSNDEE